VLEYHRMGFGFTTLKPYCAVKTPDTVTFVLAGRGAAAGGAFVGGGTAAGADATAEGAAAGCGAAAGGGTAAGGAFVEGTAVVFPVTLMIFVMKIRLPEIS